MAKATFRIWRGDAKGGAFRDYLTEVGDLKWRPIVPDAMKPVLTQVGTQQAKPESPLATPKPAVPVKKPQP